MQFLVLLLIIVLGLIVGSFINALEYRLDTELSIAKGRSICPKCKKPIAWYDNIPVASYLILLGKCRKCKQTISAQYPLVELITSVSFVSVVYSSGMALGLSNLINGLPTQTPATNMFIGFLCLVIAVGSLVVIGLHDAKTSYIVSSAVYVGVASIVVYRLAIYSGSFTLPALWNSHSALLVATAIPALMFAGLHYFSKGRWMGAGDIELAVLVGLFAGWPGILSAYYFAFIVGSIWGLALVYLTRKVKMKSEMPFGPFLVSGALFGFVFGQQIFELYARIFLGA